MAIPNKTARIESIDEYRNHVLSQPWAGGIDKAEVVDFLAELDDNRFSSLLYQRPHDRPYIQPRGGFPTFAQQLRLNVALIDAGADFLPLTIDSYTRHNNYDTASELLQRSEAEDSDYLNGYPLVCHGYLLSRDLYQKANCPISLRHGTPDARLLVEIAIASGITDIEGGGLCYCLPYSEAFPVDRSLLYWQYVDRLCAIHSADDRHIQRESFGPLTATMVPPAITICVQVIEALLAAEQGIKSFTVSFGQHGSVEQDIAAAKVLKPFTCELLSRFGFDDVEIHLAYHQWMGQFPHDRSKAMALIAGSAMVASMVRADKVVTKTVEEAVGIPRPDANADAVSAVRYVFDTLLADEHFSSQRIDGEVELLRSECQSIMDAVFDLPGDQFWQSIYRAFQIGFIDIPFSPHIRNTNRLLSIRDHTGAIRISNPGNVPIRRSELIQERELLADRQVTKGSTYKHLLADINFMA